MGLLSLGATFVMDLLLSSRGRHRDRITAEVKARLEMLPDYAVSVLPMSDKIVGRLAVRFKDWVSTMLQGCEAEIDLCI
jgi:hypothetical protein